MTNADTLSRDLKFDASPENVAYVQAAALVGIFCELEILNERLSQITTARNQGDASLALNVEVNR